MDRLSLVTAHAVGNEPFCRRGIEIGLFGATLTARGGAVPHRARRRSRATPTSEAAPSRSSSSATPSKARRLTSPGLRAADRSAISQSSTASKASRYSAASPSAPARARQAPLPAACFAERRRVEDAGSPAKAPPEHRIEFAGCRSDAPIRIIVFGPQDRRDSPRSSSCSLDGEWKISATSGAAPGYTRLEGPSHRRISTDSTCPPTAP